MMNDVGSGEGFEADSRPQRATLDGAVTLPSRLVTAMLDWLVRRSKGAFGELSTRADRLGHHGLVWGALVFAAFVLLENFFAPLQKLLIVALALLGAGLGQFAALRFTDMCEMLVRNTPTRMSNILVFQFLGLLLVLGAAVSLLLGLITLRESGRETILGLYVGLASAVGLLVPGLLMLDPQDTLHVRVDASCTAGEDGLGLIGTLLKGYLAGARLIFGCLCALGGLAVIVGVPLVLLARDSWSVLGINLTLTGVWTICIGALTPLLLYLVSVLYYVVVDVLSAVIRRARAGV